MRNSIPISWLYIHTASIKVSNSFSFLANNLMSYIRWLIFSCNSVILYLPIHFKSMWFSGIIAITNSDGDSTSPWNIPLWIFTLAKIFVLFSMVSSIWSKIFVSILYGFVDMVLRFSFLFSMVSSIWSCRPSCSFWDNNPALRDAFL